MESSLMRDRRGNRGEEDCWDRYLNNKWKAQKCSKTVGRFERTPLCAHPSADHHCSVGWIILTVVVPLVLLTGLVFWLRKHWWVFVSVFPTLSLSLHLLAHLFFLSLFSVFLLSALSSYLSAPSFSPPSHVEWLPSLCSSGHTVNPQALFSLWKEIPAAQELRTHVDIGQWWWPFHSPCIPVLVVVYFYLMIDIS